MAVCPECEADVPLPNGTETSELLSCAECGSELEVTSLNPQTVEKAPEEEEDWGQ